MSNIINNKIIDEIRILLINLRKMRQFYLAFPIQDSVSRKLSWIHYRALNGANDE